MKTKKHNAVPCGSKQAKGISREVLLKDLMSAYGIDQDALCVLMVLASPNGYPRLFYKVLNCLRGFDRRMQIEIVENLALYHSSDAYVLTGIEHIDTMLADLYRLIDDELLEFV